MRFGFLFGCALLVVACGSSDDSTADGGTNDGQSNSDGSSNDGAGKDSAGQDGSLGDGGIIEDAGGNCTPPGTQCAQPCPQGTVCVFDPMKPVGCVPIPPACNGTPSCACMATCFCPPPAKCFQQGPQLDCAP